MGMALFHQILSGKYPAVASGATVGNLEVPGAPVIGDLD